ncbi:uncharacterized protein PRCAT00006272001 [Priceomyces carsonii]|uniref:uncharacterized protein n=1 Tax=Priceomyces carsonii TaxID=28549 RepID=UPI002ED8F847|nr:unnamed protein product [Priceomyces carsonii]
MTFQSNHETYFSIPQGIEGPEELSDWYTDQGVDLANLYYLKMKTQGTAFQADTAQVFFEHVKSGNYERKFGPSPELRKVIISSARNENNLEGVNDRLLVNPDGTYREGTVDLGDNRLNLMMSFINEKFEGINEKFEGINRRFDVIDRKIERIEKQLRSTSSRFDNKFKAQGGRPGSADAYEQIANRVGLYPSDENLDDLTSLAQVDRLRGRQLKRFLEFYGLSTEGRERQKRDRLLQYIGVNMERNTTINMDQERGAKI